MVRCFADMVVAVINHRLRMNFHIHTAYIVYTLGPVMGYFTRQINNNTQTNKQHNKIKTLNTKYTRLTNKYATIHKDEKHIWYATIKQYTLWTLQIYKTHTDSINNHDILRWEWYNMKVRILRYSPS